MPFELLIPPDERRIMRSTIVSLFVFNCDQGCYMKYFDFWLIVYSSDPFLIFYFAPIERALSFIIHTQQTINTQPYRLFLTAKGLNFDYSTMTKFRTPRQQFFSVKNGQKWLKMRAPYFLTF